METKNLKPTKTNIIIEKTLPEAKSSGGVILNNVGTPNDNRGVVVESNNALEYPKGTEVIFGPEVLASDTVKGQTLLFMNVNNILAIFK